MPFVHLLVKVSTRSRCNSIAFLLKEKALPGHSYTFPGAAHITDIVTPGTGVP